MTDRPLALVLRALGTNCEEETARALQLGGADTRTLHLERLAENPRQLDEARLLVIPGGFSYGDYVAAGRLFGHELRERLGEAIGAFVEGGGRVLGVCNGFQVLVELGLIDGLGTRPDQRRIALTANRSNHYECRWIFLRNEPSRCAWLPAGEIWPSPVAHAEGRVALASDDDLDRLERAGQIVLRYVRADGERAEYPDCPNGSVSEIAGLCDPTGRVLGLMPHPERNLTPWQHPHWTRRPPRQEGEGAAFYRRLVGALE